MTASGRQERLLALPAYSALVEDELRRRFGVPFPDGLRQEVERGHAARTLPADLVDEWGRRSGLADLPPRSAR